MSTKGKTLVTEGKTLVAEGKEGAQPTGQPCLRLKLKEAMVIKGKTLVTEGKTFIKRLGEAQ